jgi:iron complex outermembrane receptor protein
MNQAMMPYQNAVRIEDAHFKQLGVFGEWTQYVSQTQRLIGGLRLDDWSAEDNRSTVSAGTAKVANPHLGDEREETLSSGFLRYEKDVKPFTLYAGLGHNKRFPDYWEFIGRESLNSITAFNVKPEATTQLDIGAIYRKDRIKASASVYYNSINDYLMIQTGVVKPAGTGTRTASVTRNIDATTWGMESELSYAITDTWRVETSLATVRGSNDTDNTSLAQLPPVELRLGVTYEKANWSAGAFWRAVDDQNRVDKGKGNIAGQDIGPSEGFNVVSLNLGWRASKDLLITSGVDNLFDENYAEHISKAGAMIAGYDQTTRINEPGRNIWLKVQLSYE